MLALRLFRILLLLGTALCLGASHLQAQSVAALRLSEVPRVRTPAAGSRVSISAVSIRKEPVALGLRRRSSRISTPIFTGTLGPLEAVVLMERTTAAMSGCLCFRLRVF